MHLSESELRVLVGMSLFIPLTPKKLPWKPNSRYRFKWFAMQRHMPLNNIHFNRKMLNEPPTSQII